MLSAPRTVYRRLGYFLAIAVLLILAKSFGLPGLNELGRLPGMSITHIPKWFGPVVNFCLALLAAIAVHHLATTRRDESPRAANVAGLVTLAVAGLGVALNWGAIAEIDPAIAWLPWFSVATALVFGAATWWIVRFRPGSRIIPPAIACVLLVAGELFVLAPKGVRQDREEPFREPPYIAFLADQPDAATARVLGLGAILFPNAATAFGIPDIRALDALYSDRYLTYIQEFISPGSTNRFTGLEQTPDGQPPEVAGNTWLDLTGVRYVMAPPALAGLLFPTISVDSVFSSLATAKVDELGANLAPMTIGRDTRAALQQERPGAFSYRVAVPKDQPRLTLAIGAIPGAGRDRDAAPVLLRTAVTALRGDTSEILFDEDLKFRGDPGKNAWFETGLDLGAYAGETITLRFSAKPSRDSVFTALGWANLAFAEPGRTGPQHAPVYEDGSVTIVENADAFPRAFLVGHVKPVASQAEAIASMRDLALDMRETAVVEGDPAELSHLATPAPDQAPPGDASIVDYGPSHVGIETRADNPALLILTDLYYPGWSATIDGKPAPIHAVDLAFRGVAVPAGTHRVDFTYAPGSFRVGLFAGRVGEI
ncbi:MAG: YfhO family protein, partial [Chloroflexota bacterium]